MKAVTVLMDLLFPPRCPFCDKLLKLDERLLCAACQAVLPWTEGSQAEQAPEFIDRCVSPLWYQGSVRESFHRYKFSGRRDYAAGYAALMAQCVRDRLAGQFDLLTFVPVSARRRRQRGYDQVYLLAKALGGELGLPPERTLNKTRHTPPQSGLTDAGARRANVLGAYQALHPAVLAGKRILLADDVITTGATLSECARILRTAGAKQVVCVTLARARGEHSSAQPQG